MKIRVTPRARKRALIVMKWWRGERPAAPTLFVDELHACFVRLLAMPETAAVIGADKRGRPVRRALLKGTRPHVFYRIDSRHDELVIVTIWGAGRGRQPAL